MTLFLQHSDGYLGMAQLQRKLLFPILPHSSAVGKQDYEFKNTGNKEIWHLLAMEHGSNSGHYRPFQNPKETERGIPNLNFEKQKVVLILNLAFKYYLWSFSWALIYTRQALCFQRSSYSQNSVLGPTESSDCLNHLPTPGYSAITSKRSPWHFWRRTFISSLFFLN